MRWLICLLLSVDTHVLVLAGLGRAPERPRPPPPLEVQLLELPPPAPRPGSPPARPVTVRATPTPRRPLVTMKVTRAADPTRTAPPHRPTVLPRPAAVPVIVPEADSAAHAPDRWTLPERAAPGVPQPGSNTLAANPPPAEPSRCREPGGDTRPLLQLIQARIDAVTPLVSGSNHCPEARGTLRLAFTISPRGYHIEHRLERPPSPCLERELEAILHLAEPYPFVAGWVPVRVRFSP